MNQQQLDQIKARAQAALPDNNPPNMDKVRAMALFRKHAANDVLELVAEVERLRAACRLVLDECQDVLYAARLEAVTREIKDALQ